MWICLYGRAEALHLLSLPEQSLADQLTFIQSSFGVSHYSMNKNNVMILLSV